jgi:uncharacterized protein (TIGR00299 family) protein
MAKVAYFDCFSGASGDMIIGSLLDAGLDLVVVKEALAGLDFSGYQLSVEKVLRSSITATKFNVVLIEEEDKHSRGFPHNHRGLSEILNIINTGKISDSVKTKSSEIFHRLGEVEAGIHNVPVEEVRFHELGAVDTIIDIVGTVFALETMKIERIYSSPLAVGSGTVKTAHGILPVPAPATLQILTNAGAPIINAPPSENPPGELLTPTGAVLITSLATEFKLPNLKVEKVGYGAGSKDFAGWPNVLRIWIGQEIGNSSDDGLVLLETNIDDMSPQIYGYLMERLFSEKAVDVWFTPIQMKKNRPAVMLSVLASSSLEAKLSEIIMRETSTLGIRSRTISRHMAQREIIEFNSSLGLAKAKIKRFGQDIVDVYPEYDDCRQLAMEHNLPLHEVSRIVEIEARQYLAERA